MRESVVVNFTHFKLAASSAPGCGVDVVANVVLANAEKFPCLGEHQEVVVKVMLKSVKAFDSKHPAAESHLQEIAFSALDRVLQTHVAMPTVGKWLNLTDFKTTRQQSQIVSAVENLAECLLHGHMVPVSVNMWTAQSVEQVDFNHSQLIDSRATFRYTLVNFIGACYRSNLNVFRVRDVLLAIDNDRCFHMKNHHYHWHRSGMYQYWPRLLDNSTCVYARQDKQFVVSLLANLRNRLSFGRDSLFPSLVSELAHDELAQNVIKRLADTFHDTDDRARMVLNHFSEDCSIL